MVDVAITAQELLRIMPNAGARVATFATLLSTAAREFSITTPRRLAHWLPQIAHESGSLSRTSENLNYSAAGLRVTFKKYFTEAQAKAYANQPERIANRVYANREGNGNEASGDGWRYRGSGLIEVTFKKGHAAVAEAFGMSLEQVSDWMRTPEGAARSAAFYWHSNGLNELADADDFNGICGMVNVGSAHAPITSINGFSERLLFRGRARQVFHA